jgi:hypothetical protein
MSLRADRYSKILRPVVPSWPSTKTLVLISFSLNETGAAAP